ncbi:MAG: tRNA (adenosine(37)-N6)-threonylcarbamoyltransferase complex dimerization subunit type 1 TsaB [Candidatus Omnitrophica bacterium CG1_02_46_14]|nr:MAG: tRNA (adenosine(37)-N6)-threonylcarbamoyltransferase complex dimerization subunit type 1 TsaB [Candidatus Omnitrophica bacterium CG1_02_46_14]
MKLLAYDTSSDVLSVAIYDGPNKIAELQSASFTRHSSILVPVLEKLLKDHRLELSKLNVLAVGLGPGSFTGLRVGITTAKVLSYVCQLKLVGVPSLETIAWKARNFEGEIAVILDAKKDKLYAGVYRFKKNKFEALHSPRLVKFEALVKNNKTPRLFLGDGVKIYRDQILQAKGCQILDTSENAMPEASQLAERALDLVKMKKWINPFSLEPLYLHPRDCNVTVRPTYDAKRRQVSGVQSSREDAAQHRRGISEMTHGAKR